MTKKPGQKKSEKIEFRVPHALKQQLSDYCADRDQTVSDVLRSAIERELSLANAQSDESDTMKNNSLRIAPFAVAGALGLSALASIPLLSSPAYANGDLRAAFNALDANKDGVLTRDEFEGDIFIEAENATGNVSLEKSFVIETDVLPENDADTVWIEKLSANCDVIPAEGEPLSDIMGEEFKRHDPNNDGKISFDEFRSAFEADMKQAFQMLDRDNSNSLSLAEFSTDVVVETEEFVECAASLDVSASSDTPEGDPHVEIIKTGPIVEFTAVTADLKKEAEAFFNELDKNNDKELSLDEFYGR